MSISNGAIRQRLIAPPLADALKNLIQRLVSKDFEQGATVIHFNFQPEDGPPARYVARSVLIENEEATQEAIRNGAEIAREGLSDEFWVESTWNGILVEYRGES